MKKLLIILTILLASPAFAGPGTLTQIEYPATVTGISASALNGSPSFTLQVGGLSTLSVAGTLTRDTATDVSMVCLQGPTAATALHPISGSSATITAGVMVLGEAAVQFKYQVTASAALPLWTMSINSEYIKCTFNGASSSATDLLTVTATGIAK